MGICKRTVLVRPGYTFIALHNCQWAGAEVATPEGPLPFLQGLSACPPQGSAVGAGRGGGGKGPLGQYEELPSGSGVSDIFPNRFSSIQVFFLSLELCSDFLEAEA